MSNKVVGFIVHNMKPFWPIYILKPTLHTKILSEPNFVTVNG